jgi:hypothetical protein
MERPTGNQLCERTTVFGDKLEIYFTPSAPENTFTFVINDLSVFPCTSWNEALEMYDHFYTPLICEKTETSLVERVLQYA